MPDFSTAADLFGVVNNIDDIRVIPVDAVNIYAVIIVSLVPTISVVIASIPFDTLMEAALKLLF